VSQVARIAITKTVPFAGSGDTLESRLRAVTLRGFPAVQIYQEANISPEIWEPERIRRQLSTPQPHVHQTHLDRVNQLAALFAEQGINLFQLPAAYDYTAYDADGRATEWTMLPPVVEHFRVPRHPEGGLDYRPLVGHQLQSLMTARQWPLNPELAQLTPHDADDDYYLMNDGSHRVHAGLERGQGVALMVISNPMPGFPYYAAPQPYDRVQVFPSKEESQDLKVHVLVAPGHKQLYRDFPSGGIKSGNVRPPRPGETIV